jgi:hypothetical protein
MRLLATVILVLAVGFLGVMGYYWIREGSLEEAGRELDEDIAGVDSATEPLQESLGNLGNATEETVDRATDGDDRT